MIIGTLRDDNGNVNKYFTPIYYMTLIVLSQVFRGYSTLLTLYDTGELLYLFAYRRSRTHSNRVVLRMSSMFFVGIDRDAMRFQGLGAILDWLADGHTSPRSDMIVNLSCNDIAFMSQFLHAQIKEVIIPHISTLLVARPFSSPFSQVYA